MILEQRGLLDLLLTGMSTIYASASAISGDGKIQVINAGGKLWFSSDYGKTWSARMSLKETRYKANNGVSNAVWPMPA